MKKLVFTIAVALGLNNYSHAQNASIGFTAGATFATYKSTVDNKSATSKNKTGFTLGLLSDVPVGKSFSFRPALNFVQKGGVEKEFGVKLATTFNYIELPLNFVYNASSKSGKFFIGAGPSISMAIGGKVKYTSTAMPELNNEADIKFGNNYEKDDFKTLDAGINVLAGYNFRSGFLIEANYYSGLSNLFITTGTDASKLHNSYIGFKIGYLLPARSKKK